MGQVIRALAKAFNYVVKNWYVIGPMITMTAEYGKKFVNWIKQKKDDKSKTDSESIGDQARDDDSPDGGK